MKINKRSVIMISLLLIVSISCCAYGNHLTTRQRKQGSVLIKQNLDPMLIKQDLVSALITSQFDSILVKRKSDTYLHEEIFAEYTQNTKLYDNYISCISVNFLSSIIFLIDDKLGKISSKWGFSPELATWIFEDYTGEIKELIYDKENISVLTDIVTRNCQAEILAIEPLKQEGSYSVQIQIKNLDLEQCVNSKEMVIKLVNNIENNDLLDISTTGILKGGVKGFAKGLVLGWGERKEIAKEMLTCIWENCGDNALLELQKMLTTVVEDIAVTNTYTGTITVLVSNGTVHIVKPDPNLANACHGIFDLNFLDMDTSSFYVRKVQELMELREERKIN